jgi:PAS domain S-box-containing protein
MASFIHTVLLVNDSAPDRELYRRCLRADASCEYRFLEADSAAVGLKLCRTEAIDVILLDHVLPDGDGFAFIEALRDEGDSPPVVVITGAGDEEIAVRAMKLGAEDYLMKCRLTPEVLQLAVRGAIENAGLRRQLRRREVELQEANQRITTIWESMSDAYATLDREWRIVYANSAAICLFRQLTGLEPEEILGKTHWEVFPWSVGQIIEREYRRAVEEQVAVNFEVLYEPSGDWFEVHAYPSSAGLGIYFRDISDRKRSEAVQRQTEAALYESEQRFREIFNTTFQFVGLLSPDGILLEANQTALTFGGLTREEAIGRPFWEVRWWTISLQTQQQLQEAIAQARQGNFVRYEVEVLGIGETTTIIDFSLKPMRNDAGQVVLLIPEGRDISDRLRNEGDRNEAERALQEQTNLLQLIVNNVGDGLLLTNLQGEFLLYNQAAERFFGRLTNERPPEEWSQTYGLFLPDQQTLFPVQELPLYRAIQGESVTDVEMFVRRELSLEGRWISISGFPVLDRNHEITGGVITCRDITDRKQNEQRLRESEERLQLGVQVGGVGIAKFDYASNTVTLSPEVAVMYGISLDELTVTRDRVHDTFHPDDRAELEQIIQQVIDPAGAGWFADEHRVMWQTGEVRWLNVRKQVFFDRSGEVPRPQYAILAAVDVTDRKRAELERIQLLAEAQAAREEAEAANRSKDQFVAIVAHELRSPLNSVMGWAKLLRTRKLEESVMAKALETIVRNTEAQVQLVEDLLDMSRMVRGTLQIQMVPVHWGGVIEAALDLVRPMAEAKQIELEVQLAAIPQISGDFNRLQQIAVNLLTNAIKFTPNQGRVSVYLERVEAQVHLRVCDTGKGIAAEFLPFIFEQFQQGQENTGAKDGLGLGLAIVKNLVELHGGTIAADSPGLGQGATFTVRLPILSAIGSASDIPGDFDINSLAGIRILAVDDEADMLDLITFVLNEAGAEVRSALNVTEALAQLSQFKPNILISDIAMGEGTGYELLQQMRLQPEGNIPAIALTAYASATYEERSLQAGFDRHLTKPVKPEVLMTAIVQLVNASNTRA